MMLNIHLTPTQKRPSLEDDLLSSVFTDSATVDPYASLLSHRMTQNNCINTTTTTTKYRNTTNNILFTNL